ncbi:hypothetical protein [Cellulomonas fengjieae]|uniref:Uncharacterized protein n=1 Tax=Cellulomonas fengjieae TaxID=2819978 RepID=A0ABS3SKF9_9CELL|nr:hypothetical protein [Cellulomonas fengjieae]MBO3085460.1 hypothetical protein [Cellulomonas fengjieae]QVI64490.1 hypothetical protein KG102_09780 [Cellulomonas fengjieae]
MTKDIVSRTDCAAAPPYVVWRALLAAAQFGLRGRARWADITYRATAHLIPHRDSTRLVLTGAPDRVPACASSLRQLHARRQAKRDLHHLAQAAS